MNFLGRQTSDILRLSQEVYSDSEVVKTLLAIANIPRKLDKPYHIVTAIKDPRTLNVIPSIAGDLVEAVLVKDAIARILVQTAR